MFNYLTTNRDLWNDFFDLKSEKGMETDITETEKEYQLAISLPGYNKENIKVSLDDGYLKVETVKNEEHQQEDAGKVIRREIYHGSQSRSYYVGNIDMNLISASFNNGILMISVPKEQLIPEDKTKYITIN